MVDGLVHCQDCRFFRCTAATCHRYPPRRRRIDVAVPVADGMDRLVVTHVDGWPLTKPHLFCGEGKMKAETECPHEAAHLDLDVVSEATSIAVLRCRHCGEMIQVRKSGG